MNKFREFMDKYLQPWVLVVVFVSLLLWGLSKEADAAEIEIGPTFLSGELSKGGQVVLSERFGRYSIGVGLTSDQTCQCRFDTTAVRTNTFIQAQRNVQVWRKVSMGLGVSYWNNQSRVFGKNMNFALNLRYDVGERFFINLRHYSNAGSGVPNLGQDAILFGWRL